MQEKAEDKENDGKGTLQSIKINATFHFPFKYVNEKGKKALLIVVKQIEVHVLLSESWK